MSSYLNIYLLPQVTEENKEPKYLLLDQYSRNSDIYQAFKENINPIYAWKDDKEQFEELTEEKLSLVREGVKEDYYKGKNRLDEYEKHCNTVDILDEIVELKDYLAELKETLSYISFLNNILFLCKHTTWGGFQGIYINID